MMFPHPDPVNATTPHISAGERKERLARTRTCAVRGHPEHVGLGRVRVRVPAVLGQLVLILVVLRVERGQPPPGPAAGRELALGDGEVLRGACFALHVERAKEKRKEDEAGEAEDEVAARDEAEAEEGGVGLCVEAGRVLAGRREHGGGDGDGGEREGEGGGFAARSALAPAGTH